VSVFPLAEHLAPDSIRSLEQAAEHRVKEATSLSASGRSLAALYFLGYAVEMCLSAAFFRSVEFALNAPIDRETRKRRMTHARQLHSPEGEPLMSGDPHPIVGWARYLEWQRTLSGRLEKDERERLREAISRAKMVYRHWRPELRYKLTDVRLAQLAEVRRGTEWFLQNRGKL
jgi:hypothetical protein